MYVFSLNETQTKPTLSGVVNQLPKYNLYLNVSENVSFIIHFEAEIKIETEHSVGVL